MALTPAIAKRLSQVTPTFRKLSVIGLMLASGPLALAADATESTLPIEECRDRFAEQAQSAGVSDTTIGRVIPELQVIQRVLELDRKQPEFTSTFTDYISRRVTEKRVEQGRALYHKHRALLEKITRESGVPGHYLIAFWGLETNYGGYLGKMDTLDALATLGCDQRRQKFFTNELMAALKLIDEGSITAGEMRGSWAGAMGHVQFMPTSYLRYAVDGDGDGRRDLWGSIPDALVSAGHFLQALGWQRGLRWGREVLLPEDFPYHLAGRNNARELTQWRDLGLTNAFGDPLPALDMRATLLLPAGHRGPAFLVYDNFDVIMGWNRSHYYGIAVGYLADRIAGAGKLSTPLPTDIPRLHRRDVESLQRALLERGLQPGEPDGILGSATRSALRQFQKNRNLVADGIPDRATLRALGVMPESESP